MNTQVQDVSRVRSKIEKIVLEFLDELVDVGVSDFRMGDLHAFVTKKGEKVAPDSPGRILRLLRSEGVIDYWIVRRADSLYRIVHVQGRT